MRPPPPSSESSSQDARSIRDGQCGKYSAYSQTKSILMKRTARWKGKEANPVGLNPVGLEPRPCRAEDGKKTRREPKLLKFRVRTSRWCGEPRFGSSTGACTDAVNTCAPCRDIGTILQSEGALEAVLPQPEFIRRIVRWKQTSGVSWWTNPASTSSFSSSFACAAREPTAFCATFCSVFFAPH